MIIYLEFRNGYQRLGAVDSVSSAFVESRVDRGEFVALDDALRRVLAPGQTPTAVVAAVFPEGSPDVSWSTVRTVVSVANALAFAWHVPASGLNVEGLDEPALTAAIRAAATAAPDARLTARYNGEPNITTSKKGV